MSLVCALCLCGAVQAVGASAGALSWICSRLRPAPLKELATATFIKFVAFQRSKEEGSLWSVLDECIDHRRSRITFNGERVSACSALLRMWSLTLLVRSPGGVLFT